MGSPAKTRAPFWTAPLDVLFDSLSRSDPPRPADAIFVLAGRPERKVYGLTLWREGIAPTLVLSVARFEWRRFPDLGLAEDGGLAALAPTIEPRRRHFFVTLNAGSATCAAVRRGRFGTLSEAKALAVAARSAGWRSVLVVSTSAHLERSALTFRRCLRGSGTECYVTPVPEAMSSVKRRGWWRDRRARRMVLAEGVKLLVYWVVLRFV